MAGWLMKAPNASAVGVELRTPEDLRSGGYLMARQTRKSKRDRGCRQQLRNRGARGAWGLFNGYESGDTDAMLNAFNRNTHRALADCVGAREIWLGWFVQGLQAMPPNHRGYHAYEADRTR